MGASETRSRITAPAPTLFSGTVPSDHSSVLFTMVRHASQNDALLREDDIAAGLTDMVVGYMTH